MKVHEITPDVDPAPWLEDLASLENAASNSYANFLDIVEKRALDPVALHGRAEQEIITAESPRAAYLALLRFVSSFRVLVSLTCLSFAT